SPRSSTLPAPPPARQTNDNVPPRTPPPHATRASARPRGAVPCSRGGAPAAPCTTLGPARLVPAAPAAVPPAAGSGGPHRPPRTFRPDSRTVHTLSAGQDTGRPRPVPRTCRRPVHTRPDRPRRAPAAPLPT